LASSDNQGTDGANAPDVVSAAFTFKDDYAAWLERLREVISGQLADGSRLAVWGAGARGISLLSGLRDAGAPISYIVDSDPAKHGKYVPLVNLPVYSAEHLKSDPVDCVLISSYTFFDEIASQLRWFSEQGGKIIKVYPVPEVV
jgi:novobiocin biosynthesis protein NovU/D-mycarose 3-C-methyltransferase